MADEKKPDEDKSINELLQEYAEDVKDKDLDDFLKAPDEEEDDDAFETGEGEEDEDDADAEAAMAAAGEPERKSGGLLSMFLIVVAFAAAGAGAYVYLNRDEGMTAIMGGFTGNDEPARAMLDAAPTPDSAPIMMPPPAQEEPPAPTPIANEAPAAEAPAPTADLLAVPTAETSAPAQAVAPETPVQDAAPPPAGDAQTAASAVDKWMAGGDSGLMESDAIAPALPEKTVEEVKARPVSAPKKETVKKEPEKKTATGTQSAASASAQPKKASSPEDEALPPPYVAIQARRNAAEPKSAAMSVDTTAKAPVIAKPAPAADAKMTPIVEGRASGTGRDVEGNVNKNLADVTAATGDTAAMVAQGGGRIELPVRTVPAPVGMMPAPAQQPVTPPLRTVPLAIEGGKSLPPGSAETRLYAQVPAISESPAPSAAAPAARPDVPAVPVAPVRAVPPPAPEPAPASSGDMHDAAAIVRAAQAAESAGRSGDALELYQKALEVDAVYGGAASIDRGAVYDRIGAIRAGR